jgi:Mrp family chromosome partitioning ATPase
MLQALKQADSPRPAPRLAAPPADATEMQSGETEIPFIEWGPHKSMEASPSVLAAPLPAGRRARVQDETAVLLVPPSPHGVLFRAVPSATPAAFVPELIAFHQPEHAVSAQYRDLLAALLARLQSDTPQALLFTSPGSCGGTTTTLLNAAITAARLGRRRVAVADANPAQPGVARALNLPERPGLREVLAGGASLDEALHATAQADLTALTAGVAVSSGGVRFLAETLRSLLRQLRQRFDLVFVDGGAWGERPETANLAAACDAVFLVLPSNEADAPAADELLRRIPEQGGKLAGCILSCHDTP